MTSSTSAVKSVLPGYFMGHAGLLDGYVDSLIHRPSSNLSIQMIGRGVRALIYFLRAFGSIIFLNNPFSGLLLLAAMLVASSYRGLLACLSLATGTLFIVCVLRDRRAIKQALSCGGAVFNCVLVGNILPLFNRHADWSMRMVTLTLSFALLSLLIHAFMKQLLARLGCNPVNAGFLFALFMFIALTNYGREYQTNFFEPVRFTALTAGSDNQTVDFRKLIAAVPIAAGKAIGVGYPMPCVLIALAAFLYSPILLCEAALSGVISVLTALSVGLPLNGIYAGQYTLNSILTGSLISIVFPMTWQLQIYILLFAAFTVLVDVTLRTAFNFSFVLALPFMISFNIAWLILPEFRGVHELIDADGDPVEPSYPEQHLYNRYRSCQTISYRNLKSREIPEESL